MSYTTVGAVGPSVADSAIVSARPRLGDMLAQLESISDGNLKILSSDNETVRDQVCGPQLCQNVTSPSLWAGSNVIIWPASDYADLSRAWLVGNAYVGTTSPFALDLTNITKAIIAVRALISAVDVKMRFSGLEIKTSSTNLLPFILAGVGLLGVVLLTRKKGKTGRTRKPKRPQRRRRR